MPWLKLDDSFFDHEKILDRSKDAKLLHLAALTYCAARSPHGVLSPAAVRVCAAKVDIDNRDQTVTELLRARLWETVPPDSPLQPVPPGSYQICDFASLLWQDTEADRLRAAARLISEIIYTRDDYKCVYCGSTEDLTLDHIIPLSRGGNNDASNLATACRSCNSSKGAKTLQEWRRNTP